MDTEFFKASLLDAIVPDDTLAEVADIVQAGAEGHSDSSRLLAIKERETLFLDERLRTLAILRIPRCGEDTLHSYLSRLTYKIDVWAIDETPPTDQNAAGSLPSKDLVYSADAIQSSEPIVLASQSEDGDQNLTLVWETEITLHRPRFRVPQPVIILIPSATISAVQRDETERDGDLTPFQPLETNVLEPMRFIPGFQENPPYLAASRLERVLPVPAAHKQRIHIPHVPSRRHRAVPPMMTRVRYQKVNMFSPGQTTLALLDLEIIPFLQIAGSITKVNVSLRNGQAESLMPSVSPLLCRSGDSLTFIYRLDQASDSNLSPGIGLVNPNIDVLSIVVQMEVLLSETCRPVVIMDWTTHVDFTQALNPTFGSPAQPIQRSNRPTSLPVNNAGSNLPTAASTTTDTITTSLQSTFDVNSRSGVSISFTSADASARVGVPFTWKVLVVNHSPKMSKIAIIPLPRIQRQTTHAQFFAKRHAPKSSTASFHPSERRHTKGGEDVDIAQAIVDENVVYAMHHSNTIPPETDLMSLTAELRIGPLAPGQCHESEIQMVAFETGSLRVDAIRVVDLAREAEEGTAAMGLFADIRDLPDIVVVRAEDNCAVST